MRKTTFLIALLALEQVYAQTPTNSAAAGLQTPTSNFQWKEAYPVPIQVPAPKPEWVSSFDNSSIPQAPVGVPGAPGNDPYCHWTSTQCKRPSDIYTCPTGRWGLVNITMISLFYIYYLFVLPFPRRYIYIIHKIANTKSVYISSPPNLIYICIYI